MTHSGKEPTISAEVDLLVVGGGVAGMTAAIEAADAGATVLLVEKGDTLGGTCPYSGGHLVELAPPHALDHLRAMSFGKTPDDVLAAYADGLHGLRAWLTILGARTDDIDERLLPNCWPNLPGADGVTYYAVDGDGGHGPALFEALAGALAARAVEVRLRTSLVDLVSESGAVVGAEVLTTDGQLARIRARHGVVLATGGFEANASMVETYLPWPGSVPVSTMGNTGDGLRAAVRAGAALWHMGACYGFWAYEAPAVEPAFPLLFFSPRHLMVDADGRRFHAETGREVHDALRRVGDLLPNHPNRPCLPAFLICDSQLLSAGPLSRFAHRSGYEWSADNTAEVDAGWIVTARSAAELATKLAMDPTTLADSVARYNAFAVAGHDDDFGRPANSMAPVDESALCAVQIRPGVATTSGGPRRDAHARVVGDDGSPIAGLYAAGNNGGVWGHLTEHGGGLTDALVFGAIAARTALATN